MQWLPIWLLSSDRTVPKAVASCTLAVVPDLVKRPDRNIDPVVEQLVLSQGGGG